MEGLFNEELNEKGVGVCDLIWGNYPYTPLEKLKRSTETYTMVASVLTEFWTGHIAIIYWELQCFNRSSWYMSFFRHCPLSKLNLLPNIHDISSFDIVSCRPVAKQWLCERRPLLGNSFVIRTNKLIGKRCFLCDPCQDVISRTSLEFS
jgi:hypothetical protein